MAEIPAGLQAALDGLYNAARSGDPTSAEPFATRAGWKSRSDSARRLVGQVFRSGLELRFTGPIFVTPAGDRAAVRTDVSQDGKETGAIWILCETVDGTWKVEGVGQDRTMVGLYLGGRFSPVTALDALPSDEEAAAWGAEHGLQPSEEDDDYLVDLRQQGFTDAQVAATHAVDAVDRIGVIFHHHKAGEPHERESMTVLQRTSEGLVPVCRGVPPARHRLFDGVSATWQPDMVGSTVRERMEHLLAQALGPLLRMAGLDGDALADGGVARFMKALEAAGTPPPLAGVDVAAIDRAWGGDVPDRMQRRIQAAVANLLRTEGIEPGEVSPDSPAGAVVLHDKAASIVQVMMLEVMRSVAPDDLSRDPIVPVAEPGAADWIRAALASLTGHTMGQA